MVSLLRVLAPWVALASAGPVATIAFSAPPRRVSGTINVPCRLSIEGADGALHLAATDDPQGSAVHYDVKRSETSVERHTTLAARSFHVDLPPGEYRLTAERGKEYGVVQQLIRVPETGDVPPVKLSLEPWIEMHRLGWFSGDTHVHRKLEELPNLLAAEDVHVAFPLTYWVRSAYESPAATGPSNRPAARLVMLPVERSPSGASVTRVYWPINTEYELFTVKGVAHTQGAVFVLNHREPLTPGAPPVAPVAQAARDQGALLDLDKHTWNWSTMIVPIMNVDLFELANNHVWRTGFQFRTWTRDALPRDWDIEHDEQGYTERGWIDWGFKTYYAFLNCGFRLRPTAGTGAGVHPVPLGFGRVYVECPDGFSYDSWVRNLNAGRSFVTTGPMLRVKFDGQPPGTVFREAQPHRARITGIAESVRPLTRIEIIVNGDVVRSIPPQNVEAATATSLVPLVSRLDEEISIEGSSWVAVRCFETLEGVGRRTSGVTLRHDGNEPRFRYAHTAPVHFEVDGPVRPRQRETAYFISQIEREIVRNRGVLADDELAEYSRALAIYRELARNARP